MVRSGDADAHTRACAAEHHPRGTGPGLDRGRHQLSEEGKHSVWVARQYCGERGKQDNCQVAVSLSVATHQASLPVYLPQEWTDDPDRRAKTGIPEDVTFQTKPEIALRRMCQMLATGVPPAVVLADPAYGNDGKFPRGITAPFGLACLACLGLPYAMGVFSSMLEIWRPGEAPAPPASAWQTAR
jgi:SRSO17 transposase